VRILHLEDNPNDAELVRIIVSREWPDCHITWVATRVAFVGEMHRSSHDLIISDFALSAMNGIDALKLAKEHAPGTPFIFLSGNIGEDRAIEAVKAGADDYVLKDRMKRLVTAIARAMREGAERKRRQEAELRIREQAEMLNQAREAILIINLDNRVIYWNAGAEHLFGWRSDEIIGRSAEEIFDAAAAGAVLAAREETLAKGQWLGELRVHDRARQPLIVESRQSLIRDEKGQPKARLCINSDITERKRLEEQFLRSQRMENLGLLAAGIAHDLNNMLAPILLAAPMLRENVHDPAGLGLLSTLEKSAERGAHLVQQILSFARGASGEKRLVQVRHLLRDISSIVTGTFPKSIRLEDFIPSDLWPVMGNPTQIHQILLNLCVNARDAMPNGGTLRLRAENRLIDLATAQRIEGARAGPFLVLHVEDTGNGIAPDVLARMWEPFFTTKETGKGTGLGLSTVRGIIENHKGFIEVVTVVGRGATFRIFLPATEGMPADALKTPTRHLPAGKGELILVVDDERNIREMTKTTLTRNGYRVLLANDGAQAAIVFAEHAAEIRLVVTDLNMPNLDGAMLGRALRKMNCGAKLLVVSGMTSSLSTRIEHRPEEFADAFLPKPFKPEVLLAKVHELLSLDDVAQVNLPSS
jgi:two-component system, cell cycle sensor histidine kinase and response regulator CckA